MRGINRVTLAGNLGRNPELRYAQNGSPIVNMSLATAHWGSPGPGEEPCEVTEWHRIVAFGKTAERCAAWLKKGRGILVEGRIQTRSWADEAGGRRWMTEIVAREVIFLSAPAATFERSEQVVEIEATA